MRMGVKKLQKTGENSCFFYENLAKNREKLSKICENLHFLTPPEKKHAHLVAPAGGANF